MASPIRHLPKKYTIIALVGLVCAVLAIPIFLSAVKQRQDIRQHADTAATIDTLDYFIPKDTSRGLNKLSYILTTDNKAYIDFQNDYQIYSWDDTNIYFLEEWRHNIPTPPIIQMKRHMAVNDTYTQTVLLTQFEQDTCNQLPTKASFTDTVTFFQHNPAFDAGGDIGKVDTIIMKYDYVTRYELFYYAKGYGLVQWEKYNPDGTVYQATAHYNTFTPFSARSCSIACSTALQTCSPLPTSTPTGTTAATNTPTPTPTLTPTLTPTGTLTPSPSPSVTPTPTPADTSLSLTLSLDGIGSGDNANKTGTGNKSPQHGSRAVHIELFDSKNMFITSRDSTLNYTGDNGNFTGVVGFGALSSGSYTLHISINQYLVNTSTTIQIVAGQSNTVPPIRLVGGDIVWDNSLDMLDYNALLGCYSDALPAKSCTDVQKLQADINDDGKVDGLDYNLFLRELKVSQ